MAFESADGVTPGLALLALALDILSAGDVMRLGFRPELWLGKGGAMSRACTKPSRHQAG